MPKIKINEIDYSKAGFDDYSNYAVVVPGFRSKRYNIDDVESGLVATLEESSERNYYEVFDENGICECLTVKDFLDNIGKVAPFSIPETEVVINEESKQTEKLKIDKHYGNQMAFQLLNLGLKVIYLDLGYIDPAILQSDDGGKTLINIVADLDIPDIEAKLAKLTDDAFWSPLKDKANYDFRFVTHGLCSGSNLGAANTAIDKLASLTFDKEGKPLVDGRGDCIALIELDETAYGKGGLTPSKVIEAIEAEVDGLDLPGTGKFSAITVPSVCYASKAMKDDEDYFGNNHFPAAMHYLACFAAMLGKGYAEWYAAAGYTKGVASLTIESTKVKLGEAAIAALEPRATGGNTGVTLNKAVNVIANFRGDYYLWGNRTAFDLGPELVASHFLNIRQLCTTIKKQLYTVCRRLTFDPNGDLLWINFCRSIEPMLNRMKADQGLFDYQILKVPTNKKATLAARIRIIPIEAVEDFDLEITLEDSFSDVSVAINE